MQTCQINFTENEGCDCYKIAAALNSRGLIDREMHRCSFGLLAFGNAFLSSKWEACMIFFHFWFFLRPFL